MSKGSIFTLILMVIFLCGCTGQNPAPLKNSTSFRSPIKESCNSLVFEGQILSKKNVLNIFDCTGWSKKYPSLNDALKRSSEESLNRLFEPFNHSLLSTLEKRKKLFDVIAMAESQGELAPLAVLLEQSLKQHHILKRLEEFVLSKELDEEEKSFVLNLFHDSPEKVLKDLIATKGFAFAFEEEKINLLKILSHDREDKIVSMTKTLIDEVASGVEKKNWKYVSSVLYSDGSPIKDWANQSLEQDSSLLLRVIESPGFIDDIKRLNLGINAGIVCHNQARSKKFKVDVGEELVYVVESLKNDTKQDFEATLLHGLTKFFAFEEFCEEETYQQGLKSYYHVVKYAMEAIQTDSDHIFIKRIHQLFNNDHFALLRFLETNLFGEARNLLLDLNQTSEDVELNRIFLEILKTPSDEDYHSMSSMMSDLGDQSALSRKIDIGVKYWNSLTQESKSDLSRLIMLALHPELNLGKVLNFNFKMLESFPSLQQDLRIYFTQPETQQDLKNLLPLMTEDAVESEFADFFSRQGLFELIKVLIKDRVPSVQNQRDPRIRSLGLEPKVNYVETTQTPKETGKHACFLELTQRYESNSSYYTLVNELPAICLKELGSIGFVGQIYLWMNSSQAFFESQFHVNNYHTKAGVWSPGMLHFIFSAAIEAQLTLASASGNQGIAANLDAIHRRLTSTDVIQSVQQLSRIVESAQKSVNIDQRIALFLERTPDEEFKNIINDTFSLFETVPTQIHLSLTKSDCRELNPRLRVESCLSNQQLTEDITELLRHLKKKNEKGDSLLKSLLGWLHPKKGVQIPFGSKQGKLKVTSIDEIIRFLMDLSDKSTRKYFTYRFNGEKLNEQGTTLDRLEVVIRDISFLNNFYGAYFKNNVAKAENYKKEIRTSENLMRLMDDSSGIFRTFHVFPKDSKDRLKNVRATYQSLAEVDNRYLQADGSYRSYGDFIQSLLSAITESSLESTQNFNPYQKPRPEIVDGHNGRFLTKVVEMSGLRHLARFVRSRLAQDLSVLDSPQFKLINTNLFGRHQVEGLQTTWEYFFDRYLDQDRNQMNLLVGDLVNFLSSLNPEEQKAIEEIAVKILILLSDDRLDSNSFDRLNQFMDLIISQWPEVRDLLSRVESRGKLLALINSSLDNFTHHPQGLSRIMGLFTDKMLTVEDMKTLIQDTSFRNEMGKFLNLYLENNHTDDDLNWLETFRIIFTNETIQWEPIKNWILDSTRSSEPKLTLSLLIRVLGENTDQGPRYKLMMDELFLNHRPQLELFFKQTFSNMHFISD